MQARLPSQISWKLLIAIVPLVVAGVIGIGLLQYNLTRRQMLADIDADIRNVADRTAANVDGLLRQRYHDLFTLAESPLISDYYHNRDFKLLDEAETYRQELEKHLLSFAKRSRAYSELLFLDQAGKVVCAVRDGRIQDVKRDAPSPRFAAIRKGSADSWWVSPLEQDDEGRTVLRYGKPIFDESGHLKGALVLTYDLAQIRSILEAIAVGRSGTVHLRTPSGDFPARAAGAVERARRARLLTAQSRLAEMPWSVLVEAPLADFLGPLERIRDAGAITAALGIAALIAILLLLVRSIMRPVPALVEAARKIGRGDLSHRIERIADDELGTLSTAFNEMAQSLESNRKVNLQLQSQLIQAEKLSAVGQLISSVAHELNNPLGALCGYAQITLLDAVQPELRKDLERIRFNALRCQKVVDNLLFFVRQSRQEKGRVNLNVVAASALELLEYRLVKTEDVAVEKDLREPLPDVIGDFQQLVQVLVNLINNACDAMEEAVRYPAGKRIRLSTRARDGHVCLRVEDNGTGIPPASRDKVFEPFFTTKEPGRGTGLGLSICRQILRDHGGSIDFETWEGKGTAFELRLPQPAESEFKALTPRPQPKLAAAVPDRRVLVADDEPDIAELIARLLKEDGDRVEIAVHGLDALRLVRDQEYDLVISDFEMEKAKGDDLYLELAKRPPSSRARLLFVTGDILNPKVLHFLQQTRSAYLSKPFDVVELRDAARRLLAQPRDASDAPS